MHQVSVVVKMSTLAKPHSDKERDVEGWFLPLTWMSRTQCAFLWLL